VVRNLWRMVEKAGFAIVMFSLVAVAIGFAKGYHPLAFGGLAIVIIAGAIVLVRATRDVTGPPRRRTAGETATAAVEPSRAKPSAAARPRSGPSAGDPDLY
jgi:type III secretory pathway component EscV